MQVGGAGDRVGALGGGGSGVSCGTAVPQQEAYTLTCETPQGVVKASRQVFIARGQRLAVDLRKDCRR